MHVASWIKKGWVAVLGCLFFSIHQGAWAQDSSKPIVIKFSHVVAADTPKGKAANLFAKRAAELTQGRVKVEVYPNSTLYKDKEEMEALQLGAVQMLAPSMSKFGPLGVREFEAFDLPFIFDNAEALHKVTNGPVGKAILAKLEAKGIKGLAYWDNGFKVMHGNFPIKLPGDLKGKKMRIQSSKVLEAQMQALGALPQVLPFSEVYQALQTGVVDGSENTASNVYTQKVYEVQSHLSITNHGYIGYVVIVNKKFWDGLPPDIQKALEQAMTEATTQANQTAQAENNAALESIRKRGKTQIYVPTRDERLAFKRVLVLVHQKMESRIGRETIRAIYQAVNFKPDSL